MTAEIIDLPGITVLKTDADKVLRAADGKLDVVIIVGVTGDGEFYFAGNISEVADVGYYLDRAKHSLMKMVDEMTEE